jgi:hypothetical protein
MVSRFSVRALPGAYPRQRHFRVVCAEGGAALNGAINLSDCIHTKVSCINPYELLRKYRCDSCGEVMTCACDEEFARRFLPHQLNEGVELETRHRISVTLGFQKGICNTCRGLPEEAHPMAETHGRTSKVGRYYWREIYFETTRRFADWAEHHGYKDYQVALRENTRTHAAIQKEVTKEFKELHNYSPKYTYQEKSQDEVIRENKVEVVRLAGIYAPHSDRRVRISEGGEDYSAEEFAALHYKRQGYEVLFVESTPFHAIFAIFMWLLIQDSSDPLVRIVGFGDRLAYEEGREGPIIWTHLPQDFGTPGYARRRADAIEKHFTLIPKERRELLWVFDYWVEPSSDLRQYLWAHKPLDVERARRLVSILPVDAIHRILSYLVTDYWRRYTGWPDLLIYKPNDYLFVEVKSSKDKLREDQKSWIRGNRTELHLPFKLVKIHRKVG